VPTTTQYDVCMFANCFVLFRTRGNSAVWKDEHEQTETAVSVFSLKKNYY